MKTQANILKTSLDLFSEYGIRAVTIEAIARGNGISKKTVYSCFSSKADLVSTLYTTMIGSLEKRILTIHENNSNVVLGFIQMNRIVLSSLPFFPQRVIQDLQRFYTSVYERIYAFRMEFLPTILSYNIETGMQAKLYRKFFNSDIIAELSLHQLNYLWSQPGGILETIPQKKIKQQFLYHLVLGVTTPAGRKIAIEYLTDSHNINKKNLIKPETV